MNLDRVLPIPLCYCDYVKTAMDLCLSRDVAQAQLLKQAQSVCIVYSCLGVKRNGGSMNANQKHREAAKAFREIAVPGFFRWARDNSHEFPAWLTVEKMGCTTLRSGPVLLQNGKKLWAKFDKAMREMKRDYNPIWDRYVQGQPGGNLPSGHTGDDAIENLLNGLYAKTAAAAASPIAESDLVDEAPPSHECETKASGDGDEGTRSKDVIAGGGAHGAQDNTDESVEADEEEADDGVATETVDAAISSDAGSEPEGDDSSTGGPEQSSDYPERPNGWLHDYLLVYCIFGRPSDSEDPDLQTARKTSGPPNRGRKRKSTGASSSDTDGDFDCTGSLGNLDSTAIRTFAGAGEIQSRATVKREHAAVAFNVQQEAYRQKRLNHSEKMLKAVEALTSNSALRHQREEEAAARNRKLAKIEDLKGQLEFLPDNSPQYMAVRAAIVTLYQTPDEAFVQPVASSATPPAPAAAGPPVAAAAASATGPPPNLPGFSGGHASGAGAAGSAGFAGGWGAFV